MEDRHATVFEKFIEMLAHGFRLLSGIVILLIFFGQQIIAGCGTKVTDIVTVPAGFEPLYAILVIIVLTAVLGTYAAMWTPFRGEYEWPNIFTVILFLALPLVIGWFFHAGPTTDLMRFAAWGYGVLVICIVIFDIFGRLIRAGEWKKALAVKKAGGGTI
jgi:hypothetical protein